MDDAHEPATVALARQLADALPGTWGLRKAGTLWLFERDDEVGWDLGGASLPKPNAPLPEQLAFAGWVIDRVMEACPEVGDWDVTGGRGGAFSVTFWEDDKPLESGYVDACVAIGHGRVDLPTAAMTAALAVLR